MSEPFGPLVTVDWLGSHLGEPDLVVVDCRFTLTDPAAGERGWLAGHLPGAAFLDLGRDLSGELRDGGAREAAIRCRMPARSRPRRAGQE